MPLPAALLAKLRKRGIASRNVETVEEVFAENYDEKENTDDRLSSENVVYEIANCPNVANRYHECTDWCAKHWGIRNFVHIPDLIEKKEKMLSKYALPAGWIEVGDPRSGRCYYWNTESDKVSWLPPQHPRAKITVSAEKIQTSSVKSRTEEVLKVKRKPVSVTMKDITEKAAPKRQRRQPAADSIDPMDPASYSEVERGGWNAGLKEETKTGVDSTASGPLFQQRPYPSPGDILRAQAASKK